MADNLFQEASTVSELIDLVIDEVQERLEQEMTDDEREEIYFDASDRFVQIVAQALFPEAEAE